MATGAEIYRMFQAGQIGPLEYAQQIVEELYREFEVETEELRAAHEQMMRYWEGDSADAAGKGVAPLINAHAQSAPLIGEAGQSMSAQKQSFADARGSVVPVPDEPAEPGFFAKAAGVVAPGTGIAEEYESYRDGMAKHEASNANNVRVMQQYTASTDDTRSALPSDFGIIEDDGALINIGTHASSAPAGSAVAGPSLGGASGIAAGGAPVAGGYSGAPTVGAPGTAAPGGLAGGPTSGVQQPAVPYTGGHGTATSTPRPMTGIPVGTAFGAPVSGTTDDTRTRSPRGRGTTARPPAGTSRAGTRMTTGSTPKAGSAASQIQRGAGAAARFSGGTPQPGKTVGVAPPASGGAAAAGAKGVTGMARGAVPAGVAGAGGGRGQGDDDKDHKDKYAVKQELDTGLVTETDELGEKVVDECTGTTVVQPVIGDPGGDPAGEPGGGPGDGKD